MSILTYEEFDSVMNGVLRELRFQDKIYDAFKEFDGECLRDLPSVNSTLMLLDKIFKDDSDYPLIDYWVYELECGDRWRTGSVTDDNGNDIPLKTTSDLYDELVRQLANKGE